MQVNDEYTVKIEKLINGGKGLAHAENFPIFIEKNVCPGDTVKIKISRLNKTYALAIAAEIIEKSRYRTEPKCSFYNICGSCDYQFINYDEQLRQKKCAAEETLHKFADFECDIQDVIPSPEIYECRCKIQYPVSQTKVSKRILSGYYRKKSHELINIRYCPMHPPVINEINEFIKLKASELNISAYDEKQHKGLLRHLIYRISSDNKNVLIIFVLNSLKYNSAVDNLAKSIISKFKNVKGICANYNNKKTNVIQGRKTEIIAGQDYYIEELSGIKYKISAGSFFQVNPLCAVKMLDTVKNIISAKISKPRILDAYSGVSCFGIWLSSIAFEIVSVEEVLGASKDAAENIKMNNISNLIIKNGDAAKEFKKMTRNGDKFDVSVIDPPRKGCSLEAIENLVKLTSKYIVYISCNVSTLARDMNILIEKGFKPVFIQPVDMFPHTRHLEIIVLFKK